MRSIKLLNGDIAFNQLGRLDWVNSEDDTLLFQRINNKLKTRKGELFYNSNYGHPELQGKINEEILLNYLNETFVEDDESIESIEIIEFKKRPGIISAGIYDVKINILKSSGDILEISVEVE